MGSLNEIEPNADVWWLPLKGDGLVNMRATKCLWTE